MTEDIQLGGFAGGGVEVGSRLFAISGADRGFGRRDFMKAAGSDAD
jgi:hypothetical protein